MRRQKIRQLAVGCLLLAPLCGQAELRKGSQSIAGFGGSADVPIGQAVESRGDDHRELRGKGGAAGAQYVYFFRSAPTLGIGLDGSSARLTDRFDLLLNPEHIDLVEHVSTFMPFLKLTFPRGRLRPYIFGGIGVARVSAEATAQPLPGFTWTDTGSAERRDVVRDRATLLAVSGAVGLDFYLNERFFLGLEARQATFSRRRYDSTVTGQQLGFVLRSPNNAQSIVLRAGVTWGGS